MSYRLRVSKRAESQTRAAADWWLENRPKAPGAFADDVEKALALIRSLPSIGEPVVHSRLSGIRRVLLSRVSYYLYYSVSHDEEAIDVLALWHTSRGRGPEL